MFESALQVHEGLSTSRRLTAWGGVEKTIRRGEVALLVGVGVATALLSSFVKLRLGIPGHAIVLTILPLSLGVAMVPRRLAGSVMGASALVTLLAIGHTGVGASAGIAATGVLLDLALHKARPGLGLYAAFVAAGVGANMIALIVRGGAKLAGAPALGGAAPLSWWGHALGAYVLLGALAGLLSAATWFHLRARSTGGA